MSSRPSRPDRPDRRRPTVDRSLLVRAAAPLAAAAVAIAIALPRPEQGSDDICALGIGLAQATVDDLSSVKGTAAPDDDYGPIPAQDLVVIYRHLDIDLLADSVPADVRDDVEVIGAFGDELLDADDAGRPPPPFDPALLEAFGAVVGWYTAACP